MMVCSHCGDRNCSEADRIAKEKFDALADAGVFLPLKTDSKHSVPSKRELNRTEECALALEQDHANEEHDANSQWKSASRKIVEAEIMGYEMELATLRGEYAHSRIKVVEHAMEIVQSQIDALKILAGKFD